jgi:hypothetical protein
METQRKAALIQEIATLRGELKVYQSREAEWERGKQECQQIDITERKQADVEIKKQLNELQRWQGVMMGRECRILDLKREVNELLDTASRSLSHPSAEL